MNITFFIPDFRGGGAQNMIVNMANEFAMRNHNVTILVVERVGPFEANVSENVRIVGLKKSRAMFALFALRTFLRSEKPDIFLSALFHVNVLAMMAKVLTPGLPTKFIVTERNQLSLRMRNRDHRRDSLTLLLVKIFYRFADSVVGISKGVAEDVEQIAGVKARWIHNPVVTKDLIAQLDVKIDEPWFDSSSAPVIVAPGRLVAQKDHETLFKAFAALLERKDARLLILGDGVLRERLEAKADELGISEHVYFKGFVDAPLPFMKRSDVFVMSSRWEGFCNVIVEALLCGLPVVATDCPSGPAEILEDGAYGALVPVGDPAEMAKALENALNEKIDGARQKARALDFSVETICDQYEALMEELRR